MKTIGITGGIGSGKSVVCNILQTKGVPCYDSDYKAKYLVNNSELLKNQIIDLLGEESYKNEMYNASFVAAKVFKDAQLMSKLNAIIHPAVGQDFDDWKNKQQGNWVVKETALLFQTQLWQTVDYSFLVQASDSKRIERIQKRDKKRSLEEIKAIIAKQGDYNQYVSKANFVIYNDDNQSIMIQIQDILKKIQF